MCRSDTFSFTVPAPRSTEPEVFTFDRIHEVHAQCARPAPPRRRVVRVLYPSTGRRYLPRAERSPAKRWLLALCLVVLLQIYTEDDVTAAAQEEVAGANGGAAAAGGVLPFASAEEEMKAATAAAAYSAYASSSSSSSTCTRDSWRVHDKTCPERAATSPRWSVNQEDSRARARNGGYVVALLYPVYHKLGSEQ